MAGAKAGASRRIITVAGCKGGVGKSVIACALALELGRGGKDVVLVDADLGGPNLHTYLGIQAPKYVMSDLLSRRVKTIDEIALQTDFPGLRFVSSAGNVPSQANPKFAQKTKIIKSVQSLNADYIIIDIGAGSSYDVMDFFSMTYDGILVMTPEPTSIVNSYGFVKNVLYRQYSQAFRQYSLVMDLLKRGMSPDTAGGILAIQDLLDELTRLSPECRQRADEMLACFRPNIIVNKTSSEEDARLGYKLKAIIEKYLVISPTFLGQVEEDPVVLVSAKRMTPFTVFAPHCSAALCVREILHHFTSPTLDERRRPSLSADALGIRGA
jgi:flagellar biosynthesis protein FlhG